MSGFKLESEDTSAKKPAIDKAPKKKTKAEQLRADLVSAVACSRDGLTAEEATQRVGAGAATVRRVLSSLHEGGELFCEGTRKGRSKRALPVYRARSDDNGTNDLDALGRSVSGMREAKERDRNPRAHQCPACGGEYVWQHIDEENGDSPVMCDTQRRIVVFAPPYDEHGCPEDPLTGYEEGSGRLVIGRPANEEERAHYRKHGNLDGVASWTIVRSTHLTVCTQWDRWMSGKASFANERERGKSFSERYSR